LRAQAGTWGAFLNNVILLAHLNDGVNFSFNRISLLRENILILRINFKAELFGQNLTAA